MYRKSYSHSFSGDVSKDILVPTTKFSEESSTKSHVWKYHDTCEDEELLLEYTLCTTKIRRG